MSGTSHPISRRTVAKGVAWTAPAISIAASAPALAASTTPDRCPEPKTFGELVAVPWENTWAASQFTGTAQRYQPWVIYPTSAPVRCDPATGTFLPHSITNATPNSGVGEPLVNGQSTSFPPVYPTNDNAYNGNSREHPDGVGKGAVITVTVTAIAGGGSPTGRPPRAARAAAARTSGRPGRRSSPATTGRTRLTAATTSWW